MIFEELSKIEAKEQGHQQRKNAWLISFFDLISLLVAFFILIYSTKDASSVKLGEIQKSFVNYVNGKEGLSYIFRQTGGKKIIIKKAEDTAYLLSVLQNTADLKSVEMGNISITPQGKGIKIALTENYKDATELQNSVEKKLFTLSRYINPLSNQLELKLYLSDNNDAYKLTEFVAGKIEDLGYENKVIRILPEILSQEKKGAEKNDSFIKIEIIINSYEAVI